MAEKQDEQTSTEDVIDQTDKDEETAASNEATASEAEESEGQKPADDTADVTDESAAEDTTTDESADEVSEVEEAPEEEDGAVAESASEAEEEPEEQDVVAEVVDEAGVDDDESGEEVSEDDAVAESASEAAEEPEEQDVVAEVADEAGVDDDEPGEEVSEDDAPEEVASAEAESAARPDEDEDSSGDDEDTSPEQTGPPPPPVAETLESFVRKDAEDETGGDTAPVEQKGPVQRMLEEKVERAVAESGEDMEVALSDRSEDSGDDGVPLTAVEDTRDLEHTGGSLGFTGEVQGRTVSLEDLEAREAEGAQDPELDDLVALYEETMTEIDEHTIVRGRVVTVGDEEVVIDIGFKSDGVVDRSEFDGEIVPGSTVEVYVERIEDRRGQLVLSKERADEVRLWQRFEEAYENDEIVQGTILRRIKGGMIVDLYGVEAFLPGSQIDVRRVRDYDQYVGKRMEFKIVKLNPSNSNIVISHKALIQKELEEQRREILENIEVGQVLEGTVKNIVDFGAFIDLGGVDGLLHITDLSWGRVSHPSEIVSLGEKLNVVVLDYDEERQRISLGLKQLKNHPWEDIGEKYEKGDVVEGKVVSITDYGAFVELEKGIEGLVHISEMSWTEHIKHPSQKVSLGQLLEVKILNIDEEEKKISLGMKQLEPNPWEGLSDRYPPGTVLEGMVRNITNFGVFVEIEPGIDGLVHISDLSWTKKIRHPSEVVDVNEEMEVQVLDIDEERQRVSLGHKQVQTNPWEQFEKAYSEGNDTKGEILRFVDTGLIVELPLEVEAFVPASQLLHDGDPSQAYEPEQELELRVIDFDRDNRKIVLSEKARKHAEKRAQRQKEKMKQREEAQKKRKEVKKQKKKQEARGATTLGELSGLEDLREALERRESEGSAQPPQEEPEDQASESSEDVEDADTGAEEGDDREA
jgi:small subunit ribosomal protein S1